MMHVFRLNDNYYLNKIILKLYLRTKILLCFGGLMTWSVAAPKKVGSFSFFSYEKLSKQVLRSPFYPHKHSNVQFLIFCHWESISQLCNMVHIKWYIIVQGWPRVKSRTGWGFRHIGVWHLVVHEYVQSLDHCNLWSPYLLFGDLIWATKSEIFAKLIIWLWVT